MKNKFLAWIFTAVFMGCAHAPMDFTSQGADVCPLHGGVMDKATVPVIYGGEPDKSLTAYLEAQSKLFPHAQRPTYINMCLNKKSDKAIVWHCLKCDEAEKAWQQKTKRFLLYRSKMPT